MNEVEQILDDLERGVVEETLLCLTEVGIGTGNPGVFGANPYPYPSKPIPVVMGTGFPRYGCGFWKNPGVC